MRKGLKLSKEQEEKAIEFLKAYFEENLDVEIGDLKGKLFLDELGKYVGVYYYNLGLQDSIGLMSEKIEDLWELEQRER